MPSRLELAATTVLVLLGATSCGGPPKPVAGAPAGSGAAATPPSPALSAASSAAAEATATPAAGRPEQAPVAASAKHAEEAPLIRPCAADGEAHDRAKRAFVQLDRQIDGLAHDADPDEANRALAALLGQPCFELARLEQPPSLVADSVLPLQTFWQQGGRDWLEHYLELGAPPEADGLRYAVIAPTMPTTLAGQAAAKHPLQPWICGEDDLACGQGTAGWQRRAERAFEAFARRQRLRRAAHDPRGSAIESPRSCADEVRKLPEAARYTRWHACIEGLPLQVATLPLGRLAEPDRGWLLLRGRRGHYEFCDELRAYDLATGAAYVAQSCGRLALRPNGQVDRKATDAARRAETISGRLELANLREAAWMLLLAAEVQPPALRVAARFPVPRHVKVARMPGRRLPGRAVELGTSTGQTELAWAFVLQGKAMRRGTLPWPASYDDAALHHAAELLQVAEASLEPGCPPARLPATLDLPGRPAVSPVDASRRSLDATYDALGEALRQLGKQRVCRRGS